MTTDRSRRQRRDAAPEAEVLSAELRRFFDSMAAHFPGHVMQRVLEPDGAVRYSYASPGLAALGLDPAAIVAEPRSAQDWIHPDDRARWRAALMASAETLGTLDEELRVIGADGRVRWVRSIGNPRRLPGGAVVWDGIALDVTDKREALDAARLAKAEADAAEAAKARLLRAAGDEVDAAIGLLRDGGAAEAALARLDAARALLTEQPSLPAAPPPQDPRLAALTQRQREVLALVAAARSNREIGAALGISEGTAKLHVAAVLKALKVQNRTEAALIGRGLERGC